MTARPIGGPELQRGILYVKGLDCDYAFVQEDHLVISFLASRPDLIGCNIREQIMFDGHYKIRHSLLQLVCMQLAKLDMGRLQNWIRGTWLARIEEVRATKRVAVAMCLHSRLGQGSEMAALGEDLVALVVGKLKDVGDDRIKRGRLVPRIKSKHDPVKARYITGAAVVWTDLSKVDLKKLNGR